MKMKKERIALLGLAAIFGLFLFGKKKEEKECAEIGSVADDDYKYMYTQFEGKPKEAILHLMKAKKGVCPKALYREDIGYIDIVWGKVYDRKLHTGHGLAHIIEKHQKEIKKLGFEIEDFIPFVIQEGIFNAKRSDSKKTYMKTN